ncbi:MAG TPA: beta-ribofuranosylaminobenzene 5'-phosphate synthase family protein [Gemmataceae bacterium]|jgi:beta-RFAP synthase|nr:beta-ribofuranosylaminobenzene 5'-phosphate synthase family protein [Gemmataceae bacterium]
MMEVITGSRLHFGLLHVPGKKEAEPHGSAAKVRFFGGAGLMIAEPCLRLEAHRAESWSAEGPCADQIMTFAQACRRKIGEDACPPLAFRCKTAPPRHAGFGSGTQLGLAVAKLIAEMSGRTDCSVKELARRVGRGERSAIGTHGFAEGGFLVEAGKHAKIELSTLVGRYPFPEDWRIVVVLPSASKTIHGVEEGRLFRDLEDDRTALRSAEVLCRLLFLGVIPALIERDYEAFGNALYEFNRKAGERFAKVQGGAFASEQVAELVETLRCEHCPAVGQSSWGPAVYAICRNEEEAGRMAIRARLFCQTAAIIATRALNFGAVAGER